MIEIGKKGMTIQRFKGLGDEIWKSFIQISLSEYNEREILDMQTIH